MAVISLANPKGGAGKTTTALLLASVLATRSASIAIVDADPEKWLSQWGRHPNKPANITIINEITEDSIADEIEAASEHHHFVIVDLEGTASLMVANAIGMSDLVLIPTQGASMDARGAAKTLKLIRNQEKIARRTIPHTVVFTRTSAAVRSRSLKNVQSQLESAGINVLRIPLVERAAYRDIFDFGGNLEDLDSTQVSNVSKAVANAQEFTAAVINQLEMANEQ